MKTDYLNVNKLPRPGGRIAYANAVNRTQAIKLCPWANYFLKVKEGFKCFENRESFIKAKSENNNE